MHRTTDVQIRSALKQKLLRHHLRCAETAIVEELGLRHGATRIDVAVLNGELRGYEIKSDCDNLDRLPAQILGFSQVFERITLVVGWRHAAAALRLVPLWWGVTLAEAGPRGGVSFAPLRIPTPNPAQDPHSIVTLLWRDEALSILEAIRAAKGVRSKSKAEIYLRLVSSIPDPRRLSRLVCGKVKVRRDWRPDAQPKLGGD